MALLFRHPEYVSAALNVADDLAESTRSCLLIRASVLAAAALRWQWQFVLGIYLPGQAEMHVEGLARVLGVPSPGLDYGRPCLEALADLLRIGQPFPFAFERAWQDVAEHILEALRADARGRSA